MHGFVRHKWRMLLIVLGKVLFVKRYFKNKNSYTSLNWSSLRYNSVIKWDGSFFVLVARMFRDKFVTSSLGSRAWYALFFFSPVMIHTIIFISENRNNITIHLRGFGSYISKQLAQCLGSKILPSHHRLWTCKQHGLMYSCLHNCLKKFSALHSKLPLR